MKKMRRFLSITVSIVLVLSMVAVSATSSLAANVTRVTKVVSVGYMGITPDGFYSVHIKFDARIDAGPVEASGITSFTNFIKLNGKTFSEISTNYPNSIRIYLGCSADPTLMELYIDSTLPSGTGLKFLQDGTKDNFEFLEGMLAPSGARVASNHNFVRNSELNFYEPFVNSAEFSQNPSQNGIDLFFNVDINYGPKEVSGNTSFTNYIKVNGNTLAEIIAQNPEISGPIAMYVSCWPGQDYNDKKLNISISKSVKAGTGMNGLNDVVEIMPGLSMTSGVVSKYQKFVLASDLKFYESISVYKISPIVAYPEWNHIRIKFTKPISSLNVNQNILDSQFNNKIKINGYTLTEMNTAPVDTNGNPLANAMTGYIWQDGTGDGFSDASEVIVNIYVSRILGGGKGLKLDSTDVMEISSGVFGYSNPYITTKTEKFIYDATSGVWNQYATASFGSYKVSSSKIISNVLDSERTVNSFKTGVSIDEGATMTFKKGETELFGSDVLGTGTTVSVSAFGVTNDYSIVIYGDVDGNGSINAIDLVAMKRHILKANLLTNSYLAAGKISNKSDITIWDLLAVKKSVLGLYNINQNQ